MNNRNILVVEDESIIAMHIASSLKQLGYNVLAIIPTGEDAVKKAEELRPDLILMDIILKGEIDGIEATDQIQSRFDIPVVYLTAHGDEATLQRAKITEPFGYILKPFKEKELHVAIEIALYRHEMEARLKKMKRWLDTTLRSIGDGVIATDKDMCVVFMNKIAEDITGWNEKDAFGKKLLEIFNIRNIKKAEPKEVENILATKVLKEGVIINLVEDHVLLTREMKEVPISDSVAPIREEKDNIPGIVIVFRDVTGQKQQE